MEPTVEEVEDLKKKEKFTAEKLLFVFTVVVLVVGFVLVYYGIKIGSVEKESKEMLMLTSDIKTSLLEVQRNLDEINKIVKKDEGDGLAP